MHAARALQIGAGLGQPVSTACPLQPTGLPASELPAGVEHRALGGGKWGGGAGMGGVVRTVSAFGVWAQGEGSPFADLIFCRRYVRRPSPALKELGTGPARGERVGRCAPHRPHEEALWGLSIEGGGACGPEGGHCPPR